MALTAIYAERLSRLEGSIEHEVADVFSRVVGNTYLIVVQGVDRIIQIERRHAAVFNRQVLADWLILRLVAAHVRNSEVSDVSGYALKANIFPSCGDAHVEYQVVRAFGCLDFLLDLLQRVLAILHADADYLDVVDGDR